MSHSFLDEVDDLADDLIDRDQGAFGQRDDNILHGLGYVIGRVLEARYPALVIAEQPMIPGEHYKKVAEEVTLIVAEVIQAWIEAGSEREVTLEELGGPIEEHIRGWSTACDGGPEQVLYTADDIGDGEEEE